MRSWHRRLLCPCRSGEQQQRGRGPELHGLILRHAGFVDLYQSRYTPPLGTLAASPERHRYLPLTPAARLRLGTLPRSPFPGSVAPHFNGNDIAFMRTVPRESSRRNVCLRDLSGLRGELPSGFGLILELLCGRIKISAGTESQSRIARFEVLEPSLGVEFERLWPRVAHAGAAGSDATVTSVHI